MKDGGSALQSVHVQEAPKTLLSPVGADRAAAGRYEVVLRDYADLGFADRALFDLANCYRRLGEEEKAAQLFEVLRRDFPQSRFIREIESAKG